MEPKHAKPKPLTLIVAFALTPNQVGMLSQFANDATKQHGRSIGRSAVMRALLRHVAAQPRAFAEEHILPRVRDDIEVQPWGGQLRKKPIKKRARVKR